MLSDRAEAKGALADKNVGPTGKKNDAAGCCAALRRERLCDKVND